MREKRQAEQLKAARHEIDRALAAEERILRELKSHRPQGESSAPPASRESTPPTDDPKSSPTPLPNPPKPSQSLPDKPGWAEKEILDRIPDLLHRAENHTAPSGWSGVRLICATNSDCQEASVKAVRKALKRIRIEEGITFDE